MYFIFHFQWKFGAEYKYLPKNQNLILALTFYTIKIFIRDTTQLAMWLGNIFLSSL